MECILLCFSFFFFFLGIHTCVGAPTLRQRSQFKHIKSTADYVCRYYPKNQRCAFSKETQTITDLITPELYHSCLQCVYTIWHGWNNSTNKNREKIPISTFLTCRLSQTAKITVSDRAWNGTKKPTHSYKNKPPSHQIFRMSFCIYWQLLGVFCNT